MGHTSDDIVRDWNFLAEHVRKNNSALLLLPEMPFYPWFAWEKKFDLSVWKQAVAVHEDWISKLKDLSSTIICGTIPVQSGSKRLNAAFVIDPKHGYRVVHPKSYLPEEEGFWEASWYHRGEGVFDPVGTSVGLIGFSICTEMWFFHHSRQYGKQGIRILAVPRATPHSTREKWLAGGRASAVVSGAFCLSSSRVHTKGQNPDLGGMGWIIDPDGKVLGLTGTKSPFITIEVDLALADRAKKTYPRYVPD